MEAMLKPSLIFDLILLAVLLVSAMASYRKGLLTALVQFAGRLFSLAGAWFVSRKGSPYLFENFLERSFVTRVQSTISQQGAVDLTALVDKYAGFLPKSIQNSIIQSVSQTLDTGAPDVAQTIVTQVVEPLFTPIIAVVVFFIAFALCKLLVSFLSAVFTSFNHLPVLGGANRSLGFLFGLLTGMLDVCLVMCIVWAVMIVTSGQLPFLNEATLSTSFGYRLFSAINPFMM